MSDFKSWESNNLIDYCSEDIENSSFCLCEVQMLIQWVKKLFIN